ncbi:MAG: Wzz/FepE/Etk N-terminal domain-containing protein [Clostridium sp.]|uniref:YveK family protein n=1 Tax=Clostridium sp. TaxID=1506 RepID=UPI00305C1641
MEEKLINFDEIIYLFKKKFWIIIVVTVLATGFGSYKASLMTPSYKASAKIFVGKSDVLMDYYSKQEIQYYSEFMNTFKEIIKLDDFLNETLKKRNISKSSFEVKNSLGFTASENTPIFTVTYTSGNEEGAAEVLTAICEEFNEQAKSILPGVKPRIIDSAKVYPIFPNKNRVVTMFFGIGVILSIGIIIVLDYLDDTVKTRGKLEKLLPIPVLGDIPNHERSFRKEKS